MTWQCAACGNCYHGGGQCQKCSQCSSCCDCGAEFDADELGLDPETDNTPNHQERTA